MESSDAIIAHDIFPYLREYKDGTIHRLSGTEVVPPGLDPKTGVTSHDVDIIPTTTTTEDGDGGDGISSSRAPSSISARIYDPAAATGVRLPLVIYLHGGAFLIAASAEPKYHHFLNALSAAANAVVLSVDYRLAPEHPLPAAFDDAWGTIRWVAAQSQKKSQQQSSDTAAAEELLVNGGRVDFSRVFIVGDSAGATIGHHMGCRVGETNPGIELKGIVHIHPYFWGRMRIGYEVMDERRQMVDAWWQYVCPSDRGSDDPLINPFVDGAPRMDKLACQRLLVCVAEKDVLRDRGIAYYQGLIKMNPKKWGTTATLELFETKGEDHVFHIFHLDGVKARQLMARLVEFINRD